MNCSIQISKDKNAWKEVLCSDLNLYDYIYIGVLLMGHPFMSIECCQWFVFLRRGPLTTEGTEVEEVLRQCRDSGRGMLLGQGLLMGKVGNR